MKKQISIVFATLALIVLSAEGAFACSCARSTPEQAFEKTPFVFVGEFQGTVHNINRIGDDPRGPIIGTGTVDVTLKVTTAYKGKMEPLVTVRTADRGPACGITAWLTEPTGSEWIIYAEPTTDKDGVAGFWASRCSHSAPLRYAPQNPRPFDSPQPRIASLLAPMAASLPGFIGGNIAILTETKISQKKK